MTDNILQKRKRITHIGTVANTSAEGDAGLPYPIDYVNDIIKGMDSNKSDSKIMSDEYFHDATLTNIQKHMLMTDGRKDNSNVAPSCASNNSNAKFKKFTAFQQRFPLMAKCQKSLKYLQHNRRIPKQRAHVNQLPKSPRKHSKANIRDLQKFNKKFNKRHKVPDFQLRKKMNNSAKELDNSCSFQSLNQKKKKHENSRNENNDYPGTSHSLHENFHNVGNNEKKNCGNLSSESDGEYEKFIKMHAPASSKNVIKKKQMKSRKNSFKTSGIISRKLSSSESDTEPKMPIHGDGHTSFSKFHKLYKSDPSLMKDVENSTCSKRSFENKNEMKQKELKHKIKAVRKRKNVQYMGKDKTIFQRDMIKETEKNNTIKRLSPAKSQQECSHFKCSDDLHVNFPAQNDETVSSPESGSDSIASRTFECVYSDSSEESSYSSENTRQKKRINKKQIQSISEESTDSKKQQIQLTSPSEELFACPDNSHNITESVQFNKHDLTQCTVLLKRDTHLDNLLTTVKDFSSNDLNSKKVMPQLERNELSQEHCKANSITTEKETISKQIGSLENNINIQIAAVCSLATMKNSDDVIFISDSSDCENDTTDRTSYNNSKSEKCKENEVGCTVTSEQHISKDNVESVVIESSNKNEELVKAQNCKTVELSSTNKEQSQNVHNEMNKVMTPESEGDSSDIEIIEIKSVTSGNSTNINICSNDVSGVKASTLVSNCPLRKPNNIPVEHNQLKAAYVLNNEFNEQNFSHVSSSVNIHEHVPLEVNKLSAITPKRCEHASKDAKENEKLKNSAKEFHTDAGTNVQCDGRNYSHSNLKNSESDDECVILHEKKVIKESSFMETSVLSNKNLSEIASKTESHVIADKQNNLNSSQEACNSLRINEPKDDLFIECCVKHNEYIGKKSSLTKSEHEILKSEHVDVKKCVADMSTDILDEKINQSKIETEDLAPDPYIIETLKKYFDMKKQREDSTNNAFPNSRLSCSREFAKNSTGISCPDIKSFRVENVLDDSISELEQFLNAEDPKRVVSGKIAHLYKLYHREMKHYEEIKRTEKNVEIGLKLLEEKQRDKITQIAYILKLYAGNTPCCQKSLDMPIKEEKRENEILKKFSSSKLADSQLSSHASEQNLVNTWAKSDAEICYSTDRVTSAHGSPAKKAIGSLPSTSKDIAVCQESAKLNLSAGLSAGPCLDESKAHLRNFILKSATSSCIKDNDISKKSISKEAICYSPTLEDSARKESSDVSVSASLLDESKEYLQNLILKSAGPSSFMMDNAIYGTKIPVKEAVCYPPTTLKNVTHKESCEVVVSASPTVGVSADESKEHLRSLILKSAASPSSIRNSGHSASNSETPVDWPFKINPDLNEKQVKELLKEKCAACRKQGKFACQGCQKICFCSEECGLLFWENGHKDTCSG